TAILTQPTPESIDGNRIHPLRKTAGMPQIASALPGPSPGTLRKLIRYIAAQPTGGEHANRAAVVPLVSRCKFRRVDWCRFDHAVLISLPAFIVEVDGGILQCVWSQNFPVHLRVFDNFPKILSVQRRNVCRSQKIGRASCRE